MEFQRQIGYLTCYRGTERQGNCGFLKLEQKGEHWCLLLQVQKLSLRQRVVGRVFYTVQEGDWAPEELLLTNGQGMHRKEGIGERFGGLTGVCIRLAGDRELRWGRCDKEEKPEKEENQGSQEKQGNSEVKGLEQSVSEAGQSSQVEPRNQAAQAGQGVEQEAALSKREKEPAAESILSTSEKEPAAESILSTSEKEPAIGDIPSTSQEKNLISPGTPEALCEEGGQTPLAETKWQQLSDLYRHIQPFRDTRDYLVIGPSDFVVLSEKSYLRANNSFLLHGYYHYGHLVLGRISRKGETVYLLGVPGRYTEREKQAAILFGFESFECEEEPAVEGQYGYYLLRVLL